MWWVRLITLTKLLNIEISFSPTAGMAINTQKARGNSKSSVLFIIKNLHILHNFFYTIF